jgi:hypothetical protein
MPPPWPPVLSNPEQRQRSRIDTVTSMQLEHRKTGVALGWVLTCGVMAVSLNVSSASDWVLLIGLGVLPPLMLLRMWHPPAPTLSERIRQVLK